MAKKIEEATRQKVAKLIPIIADKAIRSYQDMVNTGGQNFMLNNNQKAYYEACKAAVSHLQLLLKLAEWAEVPLEKSDLIGDEIKLLLENSQELERQRQSRFEGDDGEVV